MPRTELAIKPEDGSDIADAWLGISDIVVNIALAAAIAVNNLRIFKSPVSDCQGAPCAMRSFIALRH
jgi:hypothetical protein